MGARKMSTIWVCLCSLVVVWSGQSLAAYANTGDIVVVNVGVVVDPSTRIGREQKVGMEIASQDFNNVSKNFKLFLHFGFSNSRDPLQAAYSAMELVKEKRVEAIIIGSETWEEATLVAEIGNESKVPILALVASPSYTLPLSTVGSQFLVKMSNNHIYTTQIKCIASLVKYHQWRRVIAVYEDDGYDTGTSLMMDHLSKALQDVGSQIEFRLVLPPMGLRTDAKEIITQELVKVLSTQSRVFVVLHSSLPVAIHLFKEAKNMGLIGRDTAWIITDSIASLLDSLNSSSISYMEGTLGIKSYYDEYTQTFKDFSNQFLVNLVKQYPQEDNFQPGIHALKAYDAITTITNALNQLGNKSISPTTFLQGILASNFTGLSGEISMKNGELEEDGRLFSIVNVVGKKYKELDIWSLKLGFIKKTSNVENESYPNEMLHGMVHWPGDVNHIPKGWAMPSNAIPLRIGVPSRTSFDKFVKVETFEDQNRTIYSGFCIDIFLEVVKILEESYALPYEFEAFNGTYDELIDCVYNKTYDAVVGDVTILASRSKHVEFTQPFTTSGLSVIVPLTSMESQKAWMFMKPFSRQMWLASIGTLFYTMVIVWFLERRNNPDFGGSWNNQLSTALWFTFTSIFFAHREKLTSNFARLTVVVWLFVVFVLTSSYTASLTSMLTVPLLERKVKDIKTLENSNAMVGCDGDSFVREYLVSVRTFKPDNILNISSEYSYSDLFANSTIVAAIIERPYATVFLHQYCKSFTKTEDHFRFAGQGFVFQKGSPLAADVSKAILKLSENGVLKQLNDKWFTPSLECSTSSKSENDVERLSIQGFWVLYLFSGAISTSCFLLFMVKLLKSYRRHCQGHVITAEDRSVWNRMIRLAQYFDKGDQSQTPISERPLAVSDEPPSDDWVNVAVRWDDDPTPEQTPDHNLIPLSVELLVRSSSFTR